MTRWRSVLEPAPLSMLGAVLAGLALRASQLGSQVPFGDEWHAIQKALDHGALEILTSFGGADHSIPVALWVELLSRTVGVGELGLRAPFLLAGVAAIAVLPWLVREHTSAFAAACFSWLLALSPLLVFYGRFARPYAVAAFCGFAALVALERHARTGRTRDTASYAVLAAFAAWLLPVLLPFLLAPLALVAARAWRLPVAERRRALGRLAALAGATGLLLLLALGPPMSADAASLGAKVAGGPLRLTAFSGAATALLGGTFPIAIATAALAVLGVARASRSGRPLLALFGAGVLAQIAALVVVRPLGLEASHILARYLIPAVPVLLLCGANGLAAAAAAVAVKLRQRPRVAWSAAALALAGSFLGGPLPAAYSRPNAWLTTDILFSTFLDIESYRAGLARVPAFYAELATRPPASLVLAEAAAEDAHYVWGNPLPLYQRVHRQRVRLAFPGGACTTAVRDGAASTAGASFHTLLDLGEPSALREAGVDFLVFHPRLYQETTMGRPALPPDAGVDPERCGRELERRFGPPVFADDTISVFALDVSAAR